MRNRNRFTSTIDDQELLFNKRITSVRKLLKRLSDDLHHTCAIIEPCKYMLMWGSLRRCLICIESSISLVSQGHIGSANALLRQMYEFILWSKLGIDADTETLKTINSYFYDKTLEKSYPVTYVLKYTDIPALNEKIDEEVIRQEGKRMYHNYSSLTHATGLAQQNPYKQDDFYWSINACLTEICTILDLFLIVFQQYCSKVMSHSGTIHIDFSDIASGKFEAEQGYLLAACVYAGEIYYKIEDYRDFLVKTQGITKTLIFKQSFLQKWTIHGERLKQLG